MGKLKQKLITEWNFVKGEFEVVDHQNNWFEIHFTSGMEHDMVWEFCLYHVFGMLLVLMPWKANFDPSKEVIRTMELWVRILSLPTEYMSFEPIQAILDYNKIGELLKLDRYTELKSKAKYARVCVKVTNARKFKGDVILLDFKNAKVKRVFNLLGMST